MPSLPCPLGARCTDGVDGMTWESVDVDFDQARKLVTDHVKAAHQASQVKSVVMEVIDELNKEQPLPEKEQVRRTLYYATPPEASVSVRCPYCETHITTEATTVVGVRCRSWIESWWCALIPFCTLCCCLRQFQHSPWDEPHKKFRF